MARVFGTAVDPDTGVPIAGRLVYAQVEVRESATELPPPAEPVVDKVLTGLDGTWELVLRQTTGHPSFYIIRVWQHETLYVDVPEGTGSHAVGTITIPPPEPGDPNEPLPPSINPDYVRRSELAVPSGVATLDAGGKLLAAQRPAGSTGDGPFAHEYVQVEPSTVWLVGHPLPFIPAGVEVLDHTGARHYPEISWPDNATVQLNFVEDVRGTVRLS